MMRVVVVVRPISFSANLITHAQTQLVKNKKSLRHVTSYSLQCFIRAMHKSPRLNMLISTIVESTK